MTCECCGGTGMEEVSHGDPNDWDVWVGRCECCNGVGAVDVASCCRCHTPVPCHLLVDGERVGLRYMHFCPSCVDEMGTALAGMVPSEAGEETRRECSSPASSIEKVTA